jgi:hypothetical protein
MNRDTRGVTLIELTAALGIAVVLAAVVFQLFIQNDFLFHDHNLVLELQQNARAVVWQIADEIRMAGQGVPLYSATFDTNVDEATAVVLAGSDESHLYIRAGISGVDSQVTSPIPLNFALGSAVTVDVVNIRVFYERLSSNPGAGRFVYIWGPSANEQWGWVRAEVISISVAGGRMVLIPRQGGSGGRAAGLDGIPANGDDVIQLIAPASITLEEIIGFTLDSGSVRRFTAINAETPSSPVWGTAAELGPDFIDLTFRYYAQTGVEIPSPVTELADRRSIRRIDVVATAETAEALASGTRQKFALGVQVVPRNLRTH